MASRDKADVDTFHKCIQYALEKLGKSKSGFERTVISKFKSKRRVGSGNELVDYSRAPCLGADQKARGLWERDWSRMGMTWHVIRVRSKDAQKQLARTSLRDLEAKKTPNIEPRRHVRILIEP